MEPALAQPMASVGQHELLLFFLQISILLSVALLAARVALRFGMPAIVGELLAGLLIGPSVLGALAPWLSGWLFPDRPQGTALLGGIGQLAVVLLVGVASMHIDLGLLRRRGMLAVRLSAASILIPLILGVAIGFLSPGSLIPHTSDQVRFALFIGVALCVSAIPVIAKTLLDMNLLHRNVGQLILVTGGVGDCVGWMLLSIVAAMSATASPRSATILVVLGKLVLTLAVAATAGRFLVRLVIRRAYRTGSTGTVLTSSVIVLLCCGAGTHALGLESALGAFLGGMLLASSHESIAGDLVTLRDVVTSIFAPLFFATAGLRLDLGTLADPRLVLFGLVLLVAAVLGKFLGAAVGCWRGGLTRREIVAVGAGMNSRGMVEIIVATVGIQIGVLSAGAYTVMVALAIATSLMAPPILRAAMSRTEQTDEERLLRETLQVDPHPPPLVEAPRGP